MNKVLAFLANEAVSGLLLAIVLLVLLCIATWAHGGQPCAQRVVKQHHAQNTVLVPYNYGRKNLLLELPADLVYSEVYQSVGVPVGTFSPLTYVAAPEGDGIQQPRLIRRITEEYAEPEETPVEEVVQEEVAEPEYCEPQKQTHCDTPTNGSCETTAKPGSASLPHPGLAVATQACAACHTGAKAKAEHRPVFFDEAGKFTATAQQKQKILDAARAGRMPPSGALDDDEYLALASWLTPSAKQTKADPPSRVARPPKPKRKVVGISLDGTSLITEETK